MAGFFASIYSLKRQTYVLLWTAGWSLFALHYLSPALSLWVPASALQTALNRWLYGLAGLCFFLGAQLYAQRKPWIKRCAIVAGFLAGGWAAPPPPLFRAAPGPAAPPAAFCRVSAPLC